MISPTLRSLAMTALIEQGQALDLRPSEAQSLVRGLAVAQGIALDQASGLDLDRLCRQLVRESGALHELALLAGLPAGPASDLALQVMSGRMDLTNLSGWSLWTDASLRQSLLSFLAPRYTLSADLLAPDTLDLLSNWSPPAGVTLPPAPEASELFAQSPKRTARIGAFGDIAFEVSEKDIFTLQSLSRRRAAKYPRHETLLSRPLIQFTGLDLWEIEISVKLDRNWCDPEARIARIVQAQEAHEHQPLAIGGRAFGNFVLESFDEQVKRLGGSGEILSCDLRLSFVEHWEPEGGSVILSRARPSSAPAVRKAPAARTATTDWNQSARANYSTNLRTDLAH